LTKIKHNDILSPDRRRVPELRMPKTAAIHVILALSEAPCRELRAVRAREAA